MNKVIEACEINGWVYYLSMDYKTRKLIYEYDAEGDEIGFTFSMLSEVGAPHQTVFREMLARRKITPVFDDVGAYDKAF